MPQSDKPNSTDDAEWTPVVKKESMSDFLFWFIIAVVLVVLHIGIVLLLR